MAASRAATAGRDAGAAVEATSLLPMAIRPRVSLLPLFVVACVCVCISSCPGSGSGGATRAAAARRCDALERRRRDRQSRAERCFDRRGVKRRRGGPCGGGPPVPYFGAAHDKCPRLYCLHHDGDMLEVDVFHSPHQYIEFLEDGRYHNDRDHRGRNRRLGNGTGRGGRVGNRSGGSVSGPFGGGGGGGVMLTRRQGAMPDKCLVLSGTVQISSSHRAHYHEAFVHLPSSLLPPPGPTRVAIIGGGDSMLLHEVLKYPTIELVLVLELDQEVVRRSFAHFKTTPHFDDPRVEWYFGDAAVSINLLPSSYFGTFDLVLIDLAENVMSNTVTKDLDVLGSVAALLDPQRGVLVENENYVSKFSGMFKHVARLTLNEVPMICGQVFTLGSNMDKLRLLRSPPNLEYMRQYHVDTVLYRPLEDVGMHYAMITHYERKRMKKKHDGSIGDDSSAIAAHSIDTDTDTVGDANGDDDGGTSSLDDDEEGHPPPPRGILNIVEAEGANRLGLRKWENLVDSIHAAVESAGFHPVSVSSTPVSSRDRGDDDLTSGRVAVVFVVMREGYVSAHAWPRLGYCAFDLHLWSKIGLLGRLRGSLLDAVGVRGGEDGFKGGETRSGGRGGGGGSESSSPPSPSPSSYGIVAGGMSPPSRQCTNPLAYGPPPPSSTGAAAARRRGVSEESSRIGVGGPTVTRKGNRTADASSQAVMEVTSTILHSLLLSVEKDEEEEEGGGAPVPPAVVAVVCGERGRGTCGAADAFLRSNSTAYIRDVIVLWSCPSHGGGSTVGDHSDDEEEGRPHETWGGSERVGGFGGADRPAVRRHFLSMCDYGDVVGAIDAALGNTNGRGGIVSSALDIEALAVVIDAGATESAIMKTDWVCDGGTTASPGGRPRQRWTRTARDRRIPAAVVVAAMRRTIDEEGVAREGGTGVAAVNWLLDMCADSFDRGDSSLHAYVEVDVEVAIAVTVDDGDGGSKKNVGKDTGDAGTLSTWKHRTTTTIGIATSGIEEVARRVSEATAEVERMDRMMGGTTPPPHEAEVAVVAVRADVALLRGARDLGWRTGAATIDGVPSEDYSSRLGLRQFHEQRPLAEQSVVRFEVVEVTKEEGGPRIAQRQLEEVTIRAISRSGCTLLALGAFNNLGGDGTLVVARMREGHAIVLGGGGGNEEAARVDLNLLTYDSSYVDHDVFADAFGGEAAPASGTSMRKTSWDEQPRGVGRVVNFDSDRKRVDRCHKDGYLPIGGSRPITAT